MKFSIQTFSKISLIAFLFVSSLSIMSCDDDDDSDTISLTGESKTYVLSSVSNPAISGTVKLEERSNHSTLVTIDLDGTTSGNTHPAHFHHNSAAETGNIIIDLNSIDGATGKSETIITEKNDGSTITYDQLLDLDAYVNVHISSSDLTTLIAQGDVGSNEITNTFKSYTLNSVNDSEISGAVRFTKRANGTTLVMVDLDGALSTGSYPVYIYDNDITTTGPIAINLNTVSGASGMSYTNVTQLNSGTAITYDQLDDFDGHIIVGSGPIDTTPVAQVNIGSNE